MTTKDRLHILWWSFINWLEIDVPRIHYLTKQAGFQLCEYGPCFRRGRRVRQNTAYVDDRLNWVFLCPSCEEENSEYWTERWSDYYSGLL